MSVDDGFRHVERCPRCAGHGTRVGVGCGRCGCCAGSGLVAVFVHHGSVVVLRPAVAEGEGR